MLRPAYKILKQRKIIYFYAKNNVWYCRKISPHTLCQIIIIGVPAWRSVVIKQLFSFLYIIIFCNIDIVQCRFGCQTFPYFCTRSRFVSRVRQNMSCFYLYVKYYVRTLYPSTHLILSQTVIVHPSIISLYLSLSLFLYTFKVPIQ